MHTPPQPPNTVPSPFHILSESPLSLRLSRCQPLLVADSGKITHEHKLVKAVTAEFPEDHVGGLDAHPSVEEVEKDQVVTTQTS